MDFLCTIMMRLNDASKVLAKSSLKVKPTELILSLGN